MKFPITKFAITIFVFLAYVAIIIQADEFHDAHGYVDEFQEKHAKLMGNLKDIVAELDHRMVVFKGKMKNYHEHKARI
jgi:hypothetical protein